MANETAWEDRRTIINIDEGWKKVFYDITTLFEEAQKLKFEVLDDSARATELKKILDQMPAGWALADLQTKYNEIKSVYDFMMSLRE